MSPGAAKRNKEESRLSWGGSLFAKNLFLSLREKIASVFLLLLSHNMRRPKRGDAVRRARTDKAPRELSAGGESRMASRTTNVPESRQALDNMKFEIAR
ncbi:MAG: hypothetical protein IJC54_05195, partial [Clostridia bacterium]|nr:hypothetical protein [Clostridia bacterium]